MSRRAIPRVSRWSRSFSPMVCVISLLGRHQIVRRRLPALTPNARSPYENQIEPPSLHVGAHYNARQETLSNLIFRISPLLILERRGGSLRRNRLDRKSTRLNSSHSQISYAVFCLKKKTS